MAGSGQFWRKCMIYSISVGKRFSEENFLKDVVLREQHSSSFLRFDNFKDAFSTKKAWEILRALLVINICSKKLFLDNSLTCLWLGKKILGTRLFTVIMKRTMYGQFVGGETPAELQRTVVSCKASGTGPILLIPNEEDPPIAERDKRYDKNEETITDCIKMMAGFGDPHPMMQIKLTALLSTDICKSLSILYPEPSNRPDIIETLAKSLNEEIKVELPDLSTDLQIQLNKGLKRLALVGKTAAFHKVILMVDAEYTYLNPALNLLTVSMMLAFNAQRTIIAYTYQNYLKGMYTTLRRDTDYISNQGVCFGAKLVRGAYMLSERAKATTLGYPDPIHSTIEDTGNMYDQSVDFMLRRIQKHPYINTVIVATHNEKAIAFAIQRMLDYNIAKHGGSIMFAQIFGMADHITYTLGKAGFLAYKSIPYGTLNDTLPYLARRADENRAVLGQTQRERELLRAALWEKLSLQKLIGFVN